MITIIYLIQERARQLLLQLDQGTLGDDVGDDVGDDDRKLTETIVSGCHNV